MCSSVQYSIEPVIVQRGLRLVTATRTACDLRRDKERRWRTESSLGSAETACGPLDHWARRDSSVPKDERADTLRGPAVQ